MATFINTTARRTALIARDLAAGVAGGLFILAMAALVVLA